MKITKDGFVWLTVEPSLAIKIWNSDIFTLYVLYSDDSESMIENESQLSAAISKGLEFGIEVGQLESPNFDISITRTEALRLLKPDESGLSISDDLNVCIMCKEYGDDEDWVGLYSEDYETILEDLDYKTFEIWLDDKQDRDEICQLIEGLNVVKQ